jgi:hypothetical protein
MAPMDRFYSFLLGVMVGYSGVILTHVIYISIIASLIATHFYLK